MARAKKVMTSKKKKTSNTLSEDVQNSMGIGGGINFGGFPANQAGAYTEELSTVNPTFANLRWYLISNFRQFLSELFVEISLVQKIVCTPVDDGLRGGVELKSHELTEEQLEELTESLDRDDDLNTVGWAAKWNRLFGGAGILVLTDQDPEEPLDLTAVGPDTPIEFRAVDMWELFWDKQNTEGYDPAIQEYDFEYYNYYGEQVHKSRVMRLKGLTAPSFIRPRLRGWGFSVVEGLIRSLNQYLRVSDVAFELLDEAKLDIFKIKNLINTLLGPDGDNLVKKRVAQTNYTKNYQNAIVMDAEDDFLQKQLSFAGIADMIEQNRIQVASDMSMPMTKLFGISSAGFNSGEDDIEVYNAMVESEVRNKIKYDILRVCEIKCQKLFGFVPDDLSLTFKPLRVLSSEQEEKVKNDKFTRLLSAFQASLLSSEEFRDACNRGKLFDVSLDKEGATGGYMADAIQEGANDPYDSKDVDNPGANRLDTRKARATEVGSAPKAPVNKPAPKSADVPADIAKADHSPRTKNADKLTLFERFLNTFDRFMGNSQFNSDQFDLASYEADGGDGWIAEERRHFFENPLDRGLWAVTEEETRRLYPEGNWKFTTWSYKKRGGMFNGDDDSSPPVSITGAP